MTTIITKASNQKFRQFQKKSKKKSQNQRLYIIKTVTYFLDFVLFWSFQISSFQNIKSHTTLKLTCTHLYSSMLASRDSLPVSPVKKSKKKSQNQRLYIIKTVTYFLDFVLFWSFILTLQVILISMLKQTCTHLYRVPECRVVRPARCPGKD
jgi:hypothetical protein